MPQMRYANKQNTVDPRLQRLLGGPQKNALEMNMVTGGGGITDRMGINNSLATKLNEIQAKGTNIQ